MGKISDNLLKIKTEVADLAKKLGRNLEDISIVVVTKNRTIEQIKELLTSGHYLLGENRLQEAKPKIQVLPQEIEWHFVGHLQTNKAKEVARLFKMIHSLDRPSLAEALQKAAEKLNRPQIDVLVQVNTSSEESKFGVTPAEALNLVKQAAQFPDLKIRGLMTMAPYEPDPEATRPCFRLLRQLRDQIAAENIPGVEMKYLSMGMTNDYLIAIEEGANMLRLGTAVFE